MAAARVEEVHADRVAAREYIASAERFRGDANLRGLGPESQLVLLHNATIAACNGILQVVGSRVTSGDRSHALRLETALEQLPGDTDELLERLDASRERRNEASYATSAFVADAILTEAHESVDELLELARSFVG
jgi:hypothetical protein